MRDARRWDGGICKRGSAGAVRQLSGIPRVPRKPHRRRRALVVLAEPRRVKRFDRCGIIIVREQHAATSLYAAAAIDALQPRTLDPVRTAARHGQGYRHLLTEC